MGRANANPQIQKLRCGVHPVDESYGFTSSKCNDMLHPRATPLGSRRHPSQVSMKPSGHHPFIKYPEIQKLDFYYGSLFDPSACGLRPSPVRSHLALASVGCVSPAGVRYTVGNGLRWRFRGLGKVVTHGPRGRCGCAVRS